MRKITLYAVRAEFAYNDDEKRKSQLAIVDAEGLFEHEPGSTICTAEQAITLFQKGYCGTYLSANDIRVVATVDGGPDVAELFDILSEKLTSIPQNSMNARCGQQQPGNALLAIAETKLLEDSCTDALQAALADGWRIIAVQPQPDQRRPDYILGRPLTSAMR